LFSYVTRELPDIVPGGAPMSPFRGAERNSRVFGRNLNVDVDVNESSGSDWDCESDNVEDGEALVRM
jgi:hypothetical protein